MAQHETRPADISLSHTAIARRYFLPIAGTLVLLTGENIVMVVTPYLLGDAIDGLLARDTRALWIFGLVSLVGLAIGISRLGADLRLNRIPSYRTSLKTQLISPIRSELSHLPLARPMMSSRNGQCHHCFQNISSFANRFQSFSRDWSFSSAIREVQPNTKPAARWCRAAASGSRRSRARSRSRSAVD